MSGDPAPGVRLARAVLLALALTHVMLPIINPNLFPNSRLVAATLLLAGAYALLLRSSLRNPVQAFWTGFAILAMVTVVAEWSGWWRSGRVLLLEGVLLMVLAYGAMTSHSAASTTAEHDPQ